jgi:protein phosphatase
MDFGSPNVPAQFSLLMNGVQAARAVLSAYKQIFALDSSQVGQLGISIPIPTFDLDIILAVSEAAKNNFERSEIIFHVRSPFYVVGDIHGNIFDLVRILIHVVPPPQSRILFLGDYVDRGEYSIEVVTLLFALSITYPDSVYLLRGNHEFESMNSTYGFAAEVNAFYPGTDLFSALNWTFAFMPLVAVIDNDIFCVHGGIAPEAKTLGRLRRIKRPLLSYGCGIVSNLVWSDPSSEYDSYDGSTRGQGVEFGVKALTEFLTALKMTKLFRAHQCVPNGIAKFGDNQLYTIFSCSSYEGQGNRCGLVFLKTTGEIEFFSLPPIEQVSRCSALLKRYGIVEGRENSDAANLRRIDSERVAKGGVAKSSSCRLESHRTLLQNTGKRLSAVLTRIGPGTAVVPPRSVSLDCLPCFADDFVT